MEVFAVAKARGQRKALGMSSGMLWVCAPWLCGYNVQVGARRSDQATVLRLSSPPSATENSSPTIDILVQ